MSSPLICSLLHQSSDPRVADDIKIVFDGCTTLWKTATRLDVLIPFHTKYDCFEVIVYNAALNEEAPRIYLNAGLMFSRLVNSSTFTERMAKVKELMTRRRREFLLEEIERDLFFEYVSSYVLSRLAVLRNAESEFKVCLEPKTADFEYDLTNPEIVSKKLIGSLQDGRCLDVIISKPEDLQPLLTRHTAKFRASIFFQGMNEVKKDVQECQESIANAALLETAALAFMNCVSIRNSRCQLNLNSARLRWAKAINKVMNRNLCAKFRERMGKIGICTPTPVLAPIVSNAELIGKKPNLCIVTSDSKVPVSAHKGDNQSCNPKSPRIDNGKENSSHYPKKLRPVTAPTHRMDQSYHCGTPRPKESTPNTFSGCKRDSNNRLLYPLQDNNEKSPLNSPRYMQSTRSCAHHNVNIKKRDDNKLPVLKNSNSTGAVGSILGTFKRFVAFR